MERKMLNKTRQRRMVKRIIPMGMRWRITARKIRRRKRIGQEKIANDHARELVEKSIKNVIKAALAQEESDKRLMEIEERQLKLDQLMLEMEN